jgi:hypothetical protein
VILRAFRELLRLHGKLRRWSAQLPPDDTV